jgi:hypothetical protein
VWRRWYLVEERIIEMRRCRGFGSGGIGKRKRRTKKRKCNILTLYNLINAFDLILILKISPLSHT